MKRSFRILRFTGAAVALLFIITPLAFAQHSALFRACNQKAKSQAEMNACANQEATRAEEERNLLYARLLAKASTQPGAGEKIKAAEQAWIGYRDAYIDAMYPAADKQAEYGTIYPMEVELLRAKLTMQHVLALKELLQQY